MSTLELQDPRDDVASEIVNMWERLNEDRRAFLDKGLEARRYVSANTTDDTEVGNSLPWKNKTTIPKLTQIADNLGSFYMAALMPTDDWFRWEGSDEESHEKANVIEAYMGTKLRMSGFRKTLEQLVRDWIIYGNCFAGVTWVKETTKSLVTGEDIVNYVGPRAFRVSPIDCMIDPQAPSFDKSPYLRRRFVPLADIMSHNETHADLPYDEAALEKMKHLRGDQGVNWLDWYKQVGFLIDGFDTFHSYLSGQYIELIDFYGDIYIPSTGELIKNKVITIADRSFVLRNAENPSWNGSKPFAHAPWRIVPDNLYGQGPLDNLVGMQYRVDHLENLKADAYDQVIHPAIVIKGDLVEDFTFGPGVKIRVGADGDIKFLRPDASVLSADNQIAMYFQYMEQMAGSPKEAAGFRTPGEKTAFEVDVLQQGADRMFNDKLNYFEEHVVSRLLNLMFEMLIRNFDITDFARVFNDDTDSLIVQEITKEDVVADGNLRPVGAKHFAQRNKRVKELQNFLAIKADPAIAPHISGLNSAKMLEEELGFEKFNLVEQDIAVKEQIITQATAQQMKQVLAGGDEGLEGGLPGEPEAELGPESPL